MLIIELTLKYGEQRGDKFGLCLPYYIGRNYFGQKVHGYEVPVNLCTGTIGTGYPVTCYCQEQVYEVGEHQRNCWHLHLKSKLDPDSSSCPVCSADREAVFELSWGSRNFFDSS